MKSLVILLVIGLSACASYPNLQEAGIGKTYEIVGAKINSPNEPSWYVMEHNQTGVTFWKHISSKTNSIVAQALIFAVDGREDDKSFFDYVISERRKNDDKTRFVDLGEQNIRTTFKDTSCIKYNSLAEDHASKSDSRKAFQYFRTMGYICRHPANKIAAIHLEVSYRSDTKDFPDSIKQMAEQYFLAAVFVNNGLLKRHN